MRPIDRAALAAAAMAVPVAAEASDTVNYTYNALGRLVAVSTTDGPNDGTAVSTSYDPAGNRSNYTVAGTGSSAPAGAAAQSSTDEPPTELDDSDGTAPPPPQPDVVIVDGIPQEEETEAPATPDEDQ